MSRISTNIGLVSGLNTGSLITQLLAIESKPITTLQGKINDDKQKTTDLDTFSAALLVLQHSATALKNADVLNARAATSSDNSVINVAADSTASLGSYQFQAVQLAQSQRLISGGYADTATTPVGAGTITIKAGGFVSPATSLAVLNGGGGVALGKIQITDRAGTKSVVDLTTARTVSDVLSAINSMPGIGVQASVQGDSFILADLTGQSLQNISVAEVSGGTTAANLGLSTGTFGSNQLTGAGIVKLSGSLQLSALNDGNGMRRAAGGADFQVILEDGTNVQVTLGNVRTVQDVVTAINQATGAAGKLTASISPTDASLVLTDTSGGGGTLTVSALNGSEAAHDLGILGTEQSGGVLHGGRLLAGLNTVLLKSLNGGAGAGQPGSLQLTDRSGQNATINLSAAASLSDVIQAINGAGIGLSAAVNAAGDGLVVRDTTGSTNSNLIIADTGGSTLASSLHLAVDTAATSVSSGDLSLRYIGENTQLSSLNGGSGVQASTIKITDSTGASRILDLASAKTIGDVINALNSSGLHIGAAINSTGDGILVTDSGGGTEKLTIADQGTSTTATDLHLAASNTGSIDGAFRYQTTIGASDTLSTIVNNINASGAPVVASIINDGSGLTPFRLQLTSVNSGSAGTLLVDTGSSGIQLSTLAAGNDALLKLASSGGSPLLFSSSTNEFTQVAQGLTLQLNSASTGNVNVNVSNDTQALAGALQSFVSSYNTASSTLAKYTSYDPATNTAADLFNDSAMSSAQQMLSGLVGQSYAGGIGAVQNLADLGISISNGQLSFDSSVLNKQLSNNADAVRSFFKAATTGFADSLKAKLSAFTDQSTGIIARRVESFKTKDADYNKRIDLLNSHIAARRQQLETQFLAMEQTLSKLQAQQTALGSLMNLFSSSSNSSSSGTSASSGSGSNTVGSNAGVSSIGSN